MLSQRGPRRLLTKGQNATQEVFLVKFQLESPQVSISNSQTENIENRWGGIGALKVKFSTELTKSTMWKTLQEKGLGFSSGSLAGGTQEKKAVGGKAFM